MQKNTLTAVIMATMLEAKPFVAGLSLEPLHKKPFLCFKNPKFILVISGIGKAHAAMATAYCCTKFNPDIVVNIGAAGALGMSKKQGDLYQINKIIEHDRPDFQTGQPIIHNIATMNDVSVNYANLSTSDKAAISIQDRKKIAIYGGELADMEGASIVQTCRKFKIPCHIFKYISDTLEDIETDSIVENIRKYRQKSFVFFRDHVIKS